VRFQCFALIFLDASADRGQDPDGHHERDHVREHEAHQADDHHEQDGSQHLGVQGRGLRDAAAFPHLPFVKLAPG
jgi:hypothetical protein